MGAPSAWVAAASIAAAFLLGLGGLVAYHAIESSDAGPARTEPRQLFSRADDCSSPCGGTTVTDTFVVLRDARELHFLVYAVLDPSSGPAYVTVTDPSGDVRYERLFTNDVSKAFEETATWQAEAGEWMLTRSYVGVTGRLQFQAWADVA